MTLSATDFKSTRLNKLHKAIQLVATLQADPTTVVETYEGLRLRIQFGADSFVRYYQRSLSVWEPDPVPIDGKVMSGADWTLLRSDGVMIFDSRITLKFIDAGKQFLLDCTLSGMTDLGKVITRGAPNSIPNDQIFDAVLRGNFQGKSWPVTLKARFEGSAGPPAREDSSWLPDELKDAGREFPKYSSLVREEFVAVGTVAVTEAPYAPATLIELTMWGDK